MKSRPKVLVALFAALAFMLAACGSGSNDGPAPPDVPTIDSTPGDGSDGGDEPTDNCKFDGKNFKEYIDCVGGNEPEPMEQAALGASPPSSDITATANNYTVEQYVSYIIGDLDTQWSGWFNRSGLQEPYIFTRMIFAGEEPYTSQCADVNGEHMPISHDHPNAFYCPVDVYVDTAGVSYQGSMILPVTTLQKMWTGDIFGSYSMVQGDFAAAIILAHEFGHHVQDEIRIQQTDLFGVTPPELTGPNTEYIADCLAGVWAASAYYSGLLETGDFQEAVAALEAIARVPSESHGDSAGRVQALLDGYNGVAGYTPGDPLGCIVQYWH